MPGIIVESLKWVYWPIPKCACTSIKAKIAEIEGLPREGRGWPHNAPFRWTDVSLPGYRDVAFVRHPFVRLYSLWMNKIADGHPIGNNYDSNGMDVSVFGRFPLDFYSGMPFENFVGIVVTIPAEKADPHWATQVSQIPPGKVQIIRIEDVRFLMELTLPKLNETRYPSKTLLDDKDSLAQIVAKVYYAEDYARFGYE